MPHPDSIGSSQDTRKALVIHPVMGEYAGGELLCLHVCKSLQDAGFDVTLASDSFEPSEVERIYGMGKIMEKCAHFAIPQFTPVASRFLTIQRLAYAKKIWPILSNTNVEIVFNTQSSPFIIRRGRVFHFVYNIIDLYAHPPEANPRAPYRSDSSFHQPLYLLEKSLRELYWEKRHSPPHWFFAVGTGVLRALREKGYANSSLLFPPCRTTFKPKFPKKDQIIQIARLIPDKRLEFFFDVARKLPEYTFYLVGKSTPASQNVYHDYSRRILASLPGNVLYVESPIRTRPDLLEESKVYLYTGSEPGIVMSVVEAISAGCIPLAPTRVGAADVIEASGVGYLYSDANEAAIQIRTILQGDSSSEEIYNISKRADIFSAKVFEEAIKGLTT